MNKRSSNQYYHVLCARRYVYEFYLQVQIKVDFERDEYYVKENDREALVLLPASVPHMGVSNIKVAFQFFHLTLPNFQGKELSCYFEIIVAHV